MYPSIKRLSVIIFPACIISLTACGDAKTTETTTTTTETTTTTTIMTDTTGQAKLADASGFERTIDGKQTQLYVLKNKNGMQITITNYGGHLVSALVPDKTGKLTSVVLGFDNYEGFKKSAGSFYGATIGRYGNRIAKGKFTLEGKEYTLAINNAPNSLHGGRKGFDQVVFDGKQTNPQTVELTYLAKDMEEGYPGNLQTKVTYHLTDDNAIQISYEATTDKTTVVNLTNHAYYNLNGEGNGDILGHQVKINADNYTPVDRTLIPTGKIESVKGTPFDFTTAKALGKDIDADNQQIKFGPGYDHNYALNKHTIKDVVATVVGDKSGIQMDIYTEEPGLQFYSGNFMAGANTIRGGAKDGKRTAFAMETQHFPDAPNQPNFASTVLKPGQVYKTQTIYKFSVKK
jgi:aldose 1-epimerase